MDKIPCEYCGRPFEPLPGFEQFCSIDCENMYDDRIYAMELIDSNSPYSPTGSGNRLRSDTV